MGRDRAAYMREYRAKRRSDGARRVEAVDSLLDRTEARLRRTEVAPLLDRITDLEKEVARLKRELASRPVSGPSFNSRPFSPVPKPGKH